eukprot:1180853-Prorocentrum_minimum.AAC.10
MEVGPIDGSKDLATDGFPTVAVREYLLSRILDGYNNSINPLKHVCYYFHPSSRLSVRCFAGDAGGAHSVLADDAEGAGADEPVRHGQGGGEPDADRGVRPPGDVQGAGEGDQGGGGGQVPPAPQDQRPGRRLPQRRDRAALLAQDPRRRHAPGEQRSEGVART